MKKSKTTNPDKCQARFSEELQVREYIGRYRPELEGCEVVISPCGNFASVREIPASGLKPEKSMK